MILKTERLILRPYTEADAADLFRYSADADVGPMCGWVPHRCVEDSLNVIKTVLSGPEAYALCLKSDNQAIGAIELMFLRQDASIEKAKECELGFWIGKPFWGKGLIPEAAREMLRHAFEDLGIDIVICSYFEGNSQSKRVQEKLGFKYVRTIEGVQLVQLNQVRTSHISQMTKEQWRDLSKIK